MQLQNLEKNQHLQVLITKANEATAEFNQYQEKATEIKANIDRNKKTLEALKAENAELQSKSDKVTVSETGEVNFSEFDDYSTQIFANSRKIKALEKVIHKFELQLEKMVLQEYNYSYSSSDQAINDVFQFYGNQLLDDLFDEQTVKKINTIFYVLRVSGDGSEYAKTKILKKVQSQLSNSFMKSFDNIQIPTKHFSYKDEGNIILSQHRTAEINRNLAELEKV